MIGLSQGADEGQPQLSIAKYYQFLLQYNDNIN